MTVLILITSFLALTSGQIMPPPGIIAEEVPTMAPTEAPVYDGTYWLAMSDKLRPGNPYRVSVQILQGQSPVSVGITFKDKKGNVVLTSPSMDVSPGGVKNYDFDVPLNISKPDVSSSGEREIWGWYPQQQYQVTVEGKGQEVSFSHETRVSYEEKAFSTFLQTDKGMYKPGQKVMFRVLTVYPDMKAVRGEPYDIFIEDSNGNRIRQWLGVKDPNGRGVLELSLQLADEVPTGDWTIKAIILEREETKTFTVDNYVLPRYEVTIETRPFAVTTDNTVNITVRATYTFGQPVTKGVAVLVIGSSGWIKINKILRRAVLSDVGTATFRVEMREIEAAYRNFYGSIRSLEGYSLNITANVTETDTGRTQVSEPSLVAFHKSAMKLKFVEEVAPESFKPGLPYTIYAEVTRADDSLFTVEEMKNVKIYFNVTYDVKLTEEEREEIRKERHAEEAMKRPSVDPNTLYVYVPYTKTLMLTLDYSKRAQSVPPNGWIHLTFNPPAEATSVNVRAWASKPYDEAREAIHYMSKAKSPSDSFMQIIVGADKPTVGTMFEVTAEATELMTQLTYQIYAKGILLETNAVSAPAGGSKTINFEFMVTRDMTPTLSLVVFYVRPENKEVVVDAMSLSANGLFQNKITVEFSRESAQPRDKVDVIVKAQEDSLVYLLAADKSTILLKGGNDLTQDDVTADMAEYTVGNDFGPWRYMWICGWPSTFSGTDAHTVLDNAGVIFLTDAHVYQEVPDMARFPELAVDSEMGLAGTSLESSAISASSDQNQLAVEAAQVVRKYFPEVWLWQSVEIAQDSGGQVVIPVTVPDTITSWITTGFSMHPESGLSIVEQPTVLVVSRPMFITLDLPKTIVRNENYCFSATVFNYYNKSLPVLVTLEKSDKFRNLHVRLDDNSIRLTTETINYSYYVGSIKTNGMKSVKFCFTPNEIGEIPVRVNALTNVQGLSDAVERIIVSKPNGVPRATNYADVVDLSDDGHWNSLVLVLFPENTVEGSQRLEVSVSGSLLNSMFDDLAGLLKRPYGCGEQNMLNFAPNIFLLQFYMNTNTLTDEVKETAREYMLIGYQKQIKYQHKKTGGFSAFGDGNGNTASTWLTAFVVKCFAMAQQLHLEDTDLVVIESEIMSKALKFLSTTQVKDGSFVEYGKVFHAEMQGASATKGVALTAYTLIALHEAMQVFKDDLSMSEMLNSAATKATSFLETSLNNNRLSDPYDICLTTYALHLVNSPSKEAAFNIMEQKAIYSGNAKYWERPKIVPEPREYWEPNTDAINIEMTAYALLVYSMRSDAVSASVPVIRWLTNNKGPNAGFHSTQDTIIGLQALSSVGSVMYSDEFVPFTVTVEYTNSTGQNNSRVFSMDKSTERLLQIAHIPYMDKSPSILNITAQTLDGSIGTSSGLVEATLHYNVKKDVTTPRFILEHKLAVTEFGFVMKIAIKAPEGESRSMSILEVDMPPGHNVDLDVLMEDDDVSRAEMKEDFLVLYFDTDKIDSRGVSVTVEFFKSGGGVLTKPEPRNIRIIDYYEPQYEVSQEYTLDPVPETEYCEAVGDVGVCSIVQARATRR